jgi:hypothetical protein
MILLPALAFAQNGSTIDSGSGATQDPARLLEEAHAEIALSHLYSADAILRDVMESPDASVAQVEEALALQCMIYSGDVLGAALLVTPLGNASQEGSGLKAEVTKQLILARRAFSISANDYLNATIGGSELAQLKLALPQFSQADVTKLEDTLASPQVLAGMVEGYATDPTPGQGLITRANQYGFYLAFSAAVQENLAQNPDSVRAAAQRGTPFDELHFLDWMARVAIDMHRLLQDPDGPDMLALAKRCDQRILAHAPENNEYAAAARSRAGSY